jgi:tetratricopeptide (TPR) repeat protein
MASKGLLSLCLLICVTSSGWAGLYNTSEPEEEKKSDPSIDKGDWFPIVYRKTLLQLRSIGIANPPFDNPLRKRYVLQADTAANIGRVSLSTEQKLNLSAAFIRRKKVDDAIALLFPLSRQEPKNFLVMSNLATAYQLSGQESRAIDALSQALSIWPKQMDKVDESFQKYLHAIGWYPSAFDFYRKAEEYQLKLLELRRREGLGQKGAKRPFETVDALFPVKFVGESGKYEVGKLAAAEKAKLPKDAIDIVQQLLIWLPEDLRLYWLLGELYNAQGGPKNIQSARMIFDELAGLNGFGVRAAELVEHRQELLNYQIPEVGGGSFAELTKNVEEIESKAKDTGLRVDWQTLGVGFGAGILVAIFGLWQIREIRRRLKK